MNQDNHLITAISASAGSGKTYRIAKEFIKYVLKNPYGVRDILAITFTNKAAAEMKERILLFLKVLSGSDDIVGSDKEKLSELAGEILDELKAEGNDNWDKSKIQKKAKAALENILYGGKGGGYSDFSVMTIDAFTTRMTKVFAYELNIPPDYAVGMNMKNIVRSSVDKVIAQADPSTEEGMNITEIIINHLIYQIEQNKSLMIENEIDSLAKDLRKLEKSFDREIEIPPVFLQDFNKGLDGTKSYVKGIHDDVKLECKKMLDKAKEFHGGEIDLSQYVQGSRGFFNYVKKYETYPNTDNMMALLERVYYQNVINENNGGIEQLRKDDNKAPGLHTPEAEEYLNEVIEIARNLDNFIRNNIAHYLTQKIVLKRIYGNLLYERVNDFTERYQEENGIIFIDELNHKISQLFESEGEVPFVYFRMGESFKKYMIDEFQDTSMVQWKNINPLVQNAMAEGEKSITVGDLKQAIYRFRGGSTEVMSALMNNPIVERENLESNWRSDTNIIALNNFFFTGILQNTEFVPASIYDGENVKQRYKKKDIPQFSDSKNAGYCELNLINKGADMKKLMLEEGELVKIIRDVLSRGYKQSSIGILVRTNSEGNEVAELLSSEDKDVRDIKILSADTLFIKDNPFVDFIINVLKYSLDNTCNEAFVRLIHLWQDIGKTKTGYESARDFVIKTLIAKGEKYFALNKDDREEALKLLWGGDAYSKYEKRISASINSVSVYESINLILEIIINPLCRDYSQSIAHITKLRNTAFSRMKEENTFNFLKYYDEYRDELNIPAPASKNAVTISTIHKAKGLQYDVVIVPFAKWNTKKNLKNEYFIYNDPRIAVQYGDLKKDYMEYFDDGAVIKKKKSEEETFFDDINLLYVAMTRACEELYVYSNTDDKYTEMDTIERVFTSKFLELKEKGLEPEEKETHEQISIGSRRTVEKKELQQEQSVQRLTAFSHKEHMFIDRQMNYIINKHKPEEESRTHGRILHEALAGIFAEKDIEPAVHVLLTEGKITENEADAYIKELQDIIKSSEFAIMFDRDYEVLNERNILFKGEIKRPDRVMIRSSKVLIFDYKTGGHEDEYEKQVREYMNAYKDMGYDARGFIAYTIDKKLQEVTA